MRLSYPLVTLLEVFLESFDGLVPPVDLLLSDGAQGSDLAVQRLELRVSPLHVVTSIVRSLPCRALPESEQHILKVG